MDDLRGVILSLFTAAAWAVAPMAFASAGRCIGAFRVNLLRIAIASIVLALFLAITCVIPAWRPVLPRSTEVLWLVISGVCGMAVGDAMYYSSLILLGPRRALQLLTISPIGSALLAWGWLGETLRPTELAGIGVVLAAIAYAIYVERAAEGDLQREPGQVSNLGVVFGIFAALFGGAGAVLARQAFTSQPDLNPLAATAVRVGSAGLALWLVPLVTGTIGGVVRSMADRHVRSRILIGSAAGPIFGMFCYVAALKYAKAGTVSTLSSMSPIVIIPLVAWRYKTRVRKRAIAAAVLAVAGVALISWQP